jgi:hypothetical protein
MLDVLIPCGRL